MTRILEAARKGPRSGKLRSAVIFLHGYGANGADLLGLANVLGQHLPDTVFVAPDAPEDVPGAPNGFQWFPVPWIDGSSQEAAAHGLDASAADLNAFLDGFLEQEGLLPGQVALFGFSQGSMLGLHVAPRREAAVAGVIAFSGRLLKHEALPSETVSRMPILLVHGNIDEVVPPQSMPMAAQALKKAGFGEVQTHVMNGIGHGIAPDGLGVALTFMHDRLGF